MVDHREYKAPNEAPEKLRKAEGAEQHTRIMWIVCFAVLVIAGLLFAFIR